MDAKQRAKAIARSVWSYRDCGCVGWDDAEETVVSDVADLLAGTEASGLQTWIAVTRAVVTDEVFDQIADAATVAGVRMPRTGE